MSPRIATKAGGVNQAQAMPVAESAAAPKRIAFFLPNLGGGGAERVALAGIKDLVDRGHQVDVVLVRAEGELLPLLPPQAKIVDLNARRLFASLLPLVRYQRERKPDAIHALMWPATVIAILAHRLARSRARLMVSDHTTLSRHARTPRERAMLRWTTRLFYPRADIRVACSAGTADDLVQLSGIPRETIDVIYNPVSPPSAIATTLAVERLWGGSGKRIITVGSMKAEKNQALLLRAFAELRGHPKAKLMIVGDGPLRPVLEQLATELGVADRVRMPGFVVDPWPWLASADLFALSSDYEGFGIALAEAMHAGLRVVSTDCVCGPREILDDGRYGALVPTGDATALAEAMAAALASPAEPERMRERAEALTGPASLARYAELLTGSEP